MHTNSSIVWAMAANASGFYVTATFAVRMGARFPSRGSSTFWSMIPSISPVCLMFDGMHPEGRDIAVSILV